MFKNIKIENQSMFSTNTKHDRKQYIEIAKYDEKNFTIEIQG